ncbi:MAG: hypothetical protein IPH03_08895 [Tetrasphaera sp.]|nr:hypothetical protein [Tetrasphaera sp.]
MMVVAAERTRKKDLQTALTSLHTVDVDPAGFVLNFVPVSASDPLSLWHLPLPTGLRSR